MPGTVGNNANLLVYRGSSKALRQQSAGSGGLRRYGLRRIGLFCIVCFLGCGEPPATVDLLPAIDAGIYLPEQTGVHLGPQRWAGEGLAYWVPVPVVPGEGWGRPTRGWRPLGSRATAEIWAPEGKEEVELTFWSRPAKTEGTSPRTVRATWDGDDLGARPLVAGETRTRWTLPTPTQPTGYRLELVFDPPVEQKATGPIDLAWTAVQWDSSGAVAPLPPADGPTSVARDGRIDHRGGGLRIVPTDLPLDVGDLSFQFRASRVEEAAAASLTLLDEEGRYELGRWSREELAAGATVELSLERWAGRAVDLLWRASGVGSWSLVHPQLSRTASEHVDSGEVSTPVPRSDGPAPDVVVVVLDAARGDRFRRQLDPGDRDLIPHLRRELHDAVWFERAYAECPTTSCSIPGLLTGRSFVGGGQVFGGRQLAAGWVTLAERLQADGYRTVGFSATPNFSPSRNTHQGFDDFVELWGEGNPNHGPYNLTRLASEVILAQPKEQPLYLHLHYLPPHQPYEPSAEFDRFTDPQYRGEVHPRMSLRPYSLGLESLEGEDLDHLVGLYDGNLLMADDVLAGLFGALRTAGRFENSLIAVTSDHGEAFFEHGFQGHNTTLYDEMLHVPLVVRFPGGRHPSQATPLANASLLDVVPTVVGALGGSPDPAWDGVDLAAGTPPGRSLFHRTSQPDSPQLALRTGRWKTVVWPPRRVQRLFDLEVDPGEQANLVGSDPERFASMAWRIRQRVDELQQTIEEGAPVVHSEEELEALRTLGYVE